MGGKSGGGYEEPASSQALAEISKNLYNTTGPLRQEFINRGEQFLGGQMDVTASPMYGALKAGTETGFNQSKDALMGLLPAGGQLNQGLTDLAAQRALGTTQNYGALAQDELNRALGLGTGMLGSVTGGLSSSASQQAAAMQAQAQSDQAKGQGIGSIAGSIIGSMVMPGIGTAIGGAIGGGVGGAAGGGW